MNKPVAIDVPLVVTAQLDIDTARLLADVAERRGQSIEQFAAEAIRRVTETEADFEAFIRKGIDEADRGELIPHAEVMAELDEMVAFHRARCRD